MTASVINIKSFLGMDGFTPHYQGDKPIEFSARVQWYMKSFYDPKKRPELYMDAVKEAVEYANKAIMLDKLGIDPSDDLEVQNPQAFRETFSELAKSVPQLEVHGQDVQLSTDLVKGGTGAINTNELYESLWKQTFDTLKTKGRM